MTLSSTYLSRKALIADNLQSMGVTSADASDGLTTLANKILDIEPSIQGLELDTNISLVSSDSSVIIGSEVVFTCVLSATYDDTSVVDVDLSGVLTGATLEFYNGYDYLGSSVTGSDGVANFSHTFDEFGDYNIRAVFAGSNNFDSCVSNIVIINVNYNLIVSSDKSVLSYNDSDVANITFTLSDGYGGVSGESLSYSIMHNDVVLDSGNMVTDNDGEVNIEYISSGVGDINIIVTYGLLQETYEIEDCFKYDSNTYTKSNSGKTTILSFDETENWQVEFDFMIQDDAHCRWGIYPQTNGNPQLTIDTEAGGGWGFIHGTSCSTSDSAEAWEVIEGSFTPTQWYHATIIKQNGIATVKLDNNTLWTGSYSCSATSRNIHMTKFDPTSTGYMKNIKIKLL